jgi:hypothetical protein
MATVLRFVNEDPNEDRDEDAAGVERRDSSEWIKGPLKQRILELCAKGYATGDIARMFERKPQTIAKFRWRHRDEIIEMREIFDTATADLYYAEQVRRISAAQNHLALIQDQLDSMLELAYREEDPIPVDLKEFRGLLAEATKIRKEIREELKPTVSLADIKIPVPKRYPGWDLPDESGDDK